MSDANPSNLRKRQLGSHEGTRSLPADEVDIASCAMIAYSSENPAHPVEHLLDGASGPGATRWMSARPDVIEQIVVEFDHPQTISRLVYEVEEAIRERTQEVRVEASEAEHTASSRFRSTPSALGEPPISVKNSG